MRSVAVCLGLFAVVFLLTGCSSSEPQAPQLNSLIVYAAGSSSAVIPIDFATRTALPAIQLPAGPVPNSLLFNPQGTRAYLGSGAGLIVLDAVQHSYVTTVASAPGTALAISPDGDRVLTAGVQVHVFRPSAGTVETFAGVSVSQAAFLDSQSAYLIGDAVYLYRAGMPLQTVSALLGSSVAVAPEGSLAYMAATPSGFPVQVHAFTTCNNTVVDTVGTGNNTFHVNASPGAGRVLALEVLNSEVRFVDITVTATGSGCPPAVTHSFTAHPSGIVVQVSTVWPLVVTSSGRAYFTYIDDGAGPFHTFLPVYNFNTATASQIPLAGATTPVSTGNGASADGRYAFVGAISTTSRAVHQVDLMAGSDVAQVALPFQPFFVALRP